MRRGNYLHNWSTCYNFMRNLRLMIILGHNWRMMRCSSVIMIVSCLSSFLHLRRSLRYASNQAFINGLNWKVPAFYVNKYKKQYSSKINFVNVSTFFLFGAFSCENLHWRTLVQFTSELISLRSCLCFLLKSWRIWFAVRYVNGWFHIALCGTFGLMPWPKWLLGDLFMEFATVFLFYGFRFCASVNAEVIFVADDLQKLYSSFKSS